MINSLYPAFRHWSDGGAVWLISDTHFDDQDCEYMNPDWPHPMKLVNRISKKVGRLDTLIHLGDVGDPQYMRHIHCKRKVLITGNHDAGASKYKEWFNEIYTGPLIVADKLILSHEPVDVPWAFNIHGHCHCRSTPWVYNLYEEPVEYNVCCDVVDFTPVNLGQLIKDGIMANIPHIHRLTIDQAIIKEDMERKGRRDIGMTVCGTKECCSNCKLCFRIDKLDYSNGGCEHSDPGGFICMVFANEGWASWMVGLEKDDGMCECFTPKGAENGKEEKENG